MELNIDRIIEAAKAGGAVIRGYFGQVLEVEEKTHVSDFRTKADTESETAVLSVIERAFPSINIYSEEMGRIDNRSELTAVVDPLDGSNNFALGVPLFTVSIAIMKGDQTILGVV